MRPFAMRLGAALSLLAGVACARPASGTPGTAVLCLDVGGRILPTVCRTSASRLDQRQDICLCPAEGERVIASICAPGVKPPPDSAALMRARHAAVSHGSLVGATYEGRPLCVDPRNAGRN